MKKIPVEIWYKKWLHGLEENPPQEVWDGIADELDLDEVWQHINDDLDTQPVTPHTTLSTIVKPIVLAGLMVLSFILSTPIMKMDSRETITSDHSTQKVKGKQPSSTSNQQALAITEEPLNPKKPLAIANDETQPVATEISYSKSAQKNIVLLKNKEPQSPTSKPETMALSYDNEAHPIENQPEIIDDIADKSKFSAGAVFGYNNVWLVNYETINGLRNDKLTHTRLTYGKELGLMLSLENPGGSEWQTEIYFLSEYGQSYKEYINALYQDKNVNLNYLKWQGMYKIPVLKNFAPLDAKVLGGMYLSYLQKSTEEIGGIISNTTENYKTWDYGLILGTEIELRMTNKLTLQPGFRIGYSLQNIFKGNESIPSDLKRTKNASAGVSIGMKYNF